MASFLKPRRGKKDTAVSDGLLLKRGEIFFEVPDSGVGTGIGKIKMGDGTTTYGSLPYFSDVSSIEVDIDEIENDIAVINNNIRSINSSISTLGTNLNKLTITNTLSLAAGSWSSSAPYTQTVNLSRITSNDRPIISMATPSTETAANYKAMKKAYGYIDKVVSNNGSLTFYCYNNKPTVQIRVLVKGV